MSDIAIFHHVFQHGDWEKIYTEQILALQQSGLFDAATYHYVGVNGNKPMPYNFKKINKTHFNTGDTSTEYCTIKALYDYSSLRRNAKVLFIHTKGVSWSYNEETKNNPITTRSGVYTNKEIYDNAQLWRKYLEFFLIKNWKRCCELLDDFDAVGTQWVPSSDIQNIIYSVPHYAGGMWWAASSYIKQLDPNFVTNNMIIGRYATELWIGTKNPKYHNFHTSDKNLYLHPIYENEYEGRL